MVLKRKILVRLRKRSSRLLKHTSLRNRRRLALLIVILLVLGPLYVFGLAHHTGSSTKKVSVIHSSLAGTATPKPSATGTATSTSAGSSPHAVPSPPSATQKAAPPQTTASNRAMWIWNADALVNTSAQNQLFNFASAQGIKTFYVYSEGLINSNPGGLRAIVNAAKSQGFNVELLFGEVQWVYNANHAQAVAFMQKAAAFSGVSAVHFDIEPQSLPEWQSDPSGLANQYLDLLAELNAAKGGLSLHVDTAMGYDVVSVTRNGVTKELTKWAIDYTDGVTLMAYRDHAAAPDGIIDHAAMAVTYAGTVGKKVTIGVETTCGLSPQKITFCEEGNKAMETELASVTATYAGSAGFGGLAIHDYAAYQVFSP